MMIALIKLPIFLLLWALFLLIKIPTIVLGLAVVPLLWKYKHTSYNNLPAWTRPWANPEDWLGGPAHYVKSLPRWWVKREGDGFGSFYQYHAIRNPANGLRSIEFLDLDVVPDLVRYKTNIYMPTYEPGAVRGGLESIYDAAPVPDSTVWYLAWQGWQAGFKLIHIWNDERHLVIKFGWRVEPADAFDRDVVELLHEDASFATKFLPWRKG